MRELPPPVTLRPAQIAILQYAGGPMAISAVPGAGKTFILEQLTARLIADDGVKPSEILILTYMRSAALNIKKRVAQTLAARGRTVYGLQALTIHAFALSIVRRARGEDLDETPLQVLSESEGRRILMAGLEAWLQEPGARAHWEAARAEKGRDEPDPFMATVRTAAKAIAEAKHHGLTPADVARRLGARHPHIAFMYQHYLDAQVAESASDYDDLIQDAVSLLRNDVDLRRWYQRHVRYVLEDEAQDSTPAQAALLDLLTSPAHGGSGHLIRVGDSNQAIMTSFTHNDPRFFRHFCDERDADGRHFPMPESSRSAKPIIDLANRLVDFVAREHSDLGVRKAFTGQHVKAATEGKANPQATHPPTWTYYVGKTKADYGTREEIGVLTHVRAYLRDHPSKRAAILVPTHKLRQAYATRAEALGVSLQPDMATGVGSRACLDLLSRVLTFLAVPAEQQTEAFLAVARKWGELRGTAFSDIDALVAFVRAVGPEGLMYPVNGLPPCRPAGVGANDYAGVLEVGRALRMFLGVRHLPGVELLPTIALALLEDVHAAAIAAKAASMAARKRDPARDALEGLRAELPEIVRSLGDRGELVPPPAELAEPEGGRLTIMTLHAAKGQEFDAVWLPNLGYYYQQKGFFPWDPANVEIWDREAFLIELALQPDSERPTTVVEAEIAARTLAVAEKLRLLYVGITRAQEEIHLSAAGPDEKAGIPPHVEWLARLCERRES